ncbi:MAG: GTP 3',8-cyclase MoaA [Planctomycetota bacterium]|nr:GTP 3',8-cyclase MoaA [Planctomycetota bacterium]
MVLPSVPALIDRLLRPLRNLRLSVTDRCNLRCSYCMPEEEYVWLPQPHILTFEEIARVVGIFSQLGVEKVRLTGGEPLLRRDLNTLVAMLALLPRIRELALTTNGVLLARHAAALRTAGLQRITVSLDTLDPRTFLQLSRRDDLHNVLAGIAAARTAGFVSIKLDTVMIAGVNDHELVRLVDFARSNGAEIRFIEYMDVGGATHWRKEMVVSRAQILSVLGHHFGPIRAVPRTDSAPAEQFLLPDGTVFGVIASVTQPFCSTCDRSRLTADGMWFRCLYAEHGTSLRELIRSSTDDAAIAAMISQTWQQRDDRGAELRAAMPDRQPLVAAAQLRSQPHLEMHTRGG